MDAHPSIRRALLGLIVAPLPSVLFLFMLDAGDRVFTYGREAIVGAALLSAYTFVVAEALSLIFGSIALGLLWYRVRPTLPICLAVGGIVAALPVAVAILLLSVDLGSNGTYSASLDGRPTVIANTKTAYGYWRDFVTLVQLFALGAIGGATFWLICRPKRNVAVDK